MPKLAANLSWIYQEVPFLQRFGAAAAHGFKAVEILFPITAHVQIAGNPDRNEPDIGEANHLYLLDVLDRLGYQGYVGLEYKPRTTTGAGLGWAAKYGIKA